MQVIVHAASQDRGFNQYNTEMRALCKQRVQVRGSSKMALNKKESPS